MNIPKPRYLYRKLAATVVGAALLLALVAAAVSFAVEYRRAKADATQRLQQLLDTVEQTASIAAYIDNAEMGDSVLARLLHNDGVHEARLSNDRALELRQSREGYGMDEAAVVRRIRAPEASSEVIGHLTVIPDRAYVLRRAGHGVLVSVVNSTVFIVLTAWIVLTIVHSSLSRPLLRVSDTLHSIAAGEKNHLRPLPGHSDDELGRLVVDINRLLDRLQRQYEAKHALLSFSLDRVREAAYLIDARARFHYANEEACRVLGYTREELLTMGVPDIDPGHPVERWSSHWDELKSQGSLTFESRHRAKNGHLFPVEISANYVEYEGVAYNLALVRDITERHRIEAALRESEAIYRSVVTAMAEGVVFQAANGEITAANPRATEILGLSVEQMQGLTSLDWAPLTIREDGSPFPVELHPSMVTLQTGRPQNDVVMGVHKPDGTLAWISINSQPLFNSGASRPFSVVTTFHDITERKAAEKVLMHYAAIVESSDDAIIGKDLAGVVTSWNAGAERMFGYCAAEAIGQPITFVIPTPYRDEERMILGEISRGHMVRHYETVRCCKDGRLIDVSVTVSPLLDTQGKIVGASKIARDITERKKTEEELRKHREHLEELVAERTEALEDANRELEAFSYSVSHDLRTPLRAIDGFSRMLSKKYEARLDQEGQRLIKVVRDNTARMSQLIDDILAFSRAGRLELRLAEVDMTQLVRTAWHDLEPLRAGRDIRLELKPLAPARGDPAMLRQVWSNLLANAIKFTRPRTTAHVEVGGMTDSEDYLYYVRDDGAGFDPAYKHKLFGVFQRLHGVEEFEGSGIGLAIVKRIVVRHGGQVMAAGKSDQGATFKFSLPASRT